MNGTQPDYLQVPLGNAHRYAEKFAAEQDSVEKGKQVYLNTLAVCGVNDYLKWLDIETALHQSDSWNWSIRTFFDIADLMLPHVGRLECRPLLPGETCLVLPQEVMQERIGYVAVQLTTKLDFVEILGFVPAKAIIGNLKVIEISQLQPLDVLINTINKRKNLVNLCQWLEGVFDSCWQSPELVLADCRRSATATRQDTKTNSVSRAKVINVGKQIVSLMELTLTNSDIFDIRLRLYPAQNDVHLPQNLELTILDESGNACMKAQAETANDWIQLEFSCHHEEKFSVELKLGETSITEEFVV